MMGLLDLLLGVFKCNHMYYIKYFFSIHFIVQVCFLLNFVHIVIFLLFQDNIMLRNVYICMVQAIILIPFVDVFLQ